MFPFFMCLTPVLLLIVLAVAFRRPALDLSVWGTVFTLGLVLFYFKTPLVTALWASLDGAVTTMPLTLVILAGIMLSNLLAETGSLKRIADWFMGGVRDSFHRGLLITLGVANFTEGAGVIAEPVVAPMLVSAGVAPTSAAALSIVGYAGLMGLELGGIIITVLALVTGLPVGELAVATAWLSIPATLALALTVPLYLPGPATLARLAWALAAGAVVSGVALVTASFVSFSIAGMAGGLALIGGLVLVGSRRLAPSRQVLKDLAPFIFILFTLLLLNTVPFLRNLVFHRLIFKISLIPVHEIILRPFFSAYLYLFAALFLAARVSGVGGADLKRLLLSGLVKCWRPSLAMSLFGAMGQMIAYSGYQEGFQTLVKTCNVPWVMAQALVQTTGSFYPLFVPLLGWVGTFLTGYGVASLMLFGQLQVSTAQAMGISATWLSAGLSVGASLGSVSSPMKIAIACPMCGAHGREGDVLRYTIPLGVAVSLVVGAALLLVV